MGSSVLRWTSPSWCTSAENHRFRSSYSKLGGHRMLSSATLPSRVSPPWLTLPPVFEGGDMVYKFYSLAEGRVKSYEKRRDVVDLDEIPPDDAKLVGSSHGWLASFDENSNHVFLSNPISGRHIKLPPVHTLPHPEMNLLDGRGSVSRVILSCSPDQDECRAMMSFGPKDRLTFCAPGASTEWTPIGDLQCECEGGEHLVRMPQQKSQEWNCNERSYENFVYSSRQMRFFCITEPKAMLEGWDLRDPLRPKMDWMISHNKEELMFAYPAYRWPARTRQEWELIDKCWHLKYLAFAEHSDELFLVIRHVVPRLRPDRSAAERIYFFGDWDYRHPYKTIDFDVFKVDRERGKLSYMWRSLEGLAIFVGTNHSLVVSAAECPELKLKPDAIYFTDEDRLITPKWLAQTNFGGHDNGIFDYQDKKLSPCCSYYPVEYHEIRRTVPPPMWFAPSLNVP